MNPLIIKKEDSRVFIDGREITNPIAKWAIIVLATLLGALIATVLIFLLLPIIGIVLTLSFAILGIILAALGIGILVLVWLFVF